ncbi:predicted protein [Uncinocarpus reesii 1704]|uniref:KAR9-domain-containing protein n=1 Tax=Uncinocarpus reesii (strain UAMH 1704) TaxID=336963 RepID=C4JFI1_UNCRE|nr:uncharacterized protein UREG_00995 [Uncinocarpus reesii 1704]EEP76146.1 predicted protein [Uncinocarpus reesii 1704]
MAANVGSPNRSIPDPISSRSRDLSPSPSLSPTPAISSCPSPDRTFSTVSSVSNLSGDGGSSISTSSRRRGYIRPQGAVFAESAKNRESVMSLGSIAHLQYYFARTGLLDGKGAQLARAKKRRDSDIPKLMLTQAQFGGDLIESPIEEASDMAEEWEENEPVMLPPTVSTYSVRTHHLPPPVDVEALRNDLQSALDKARNVLTATKDQLAAHASTPVLIDQAAENLSETREEPLESPGPSKIPQGWHEIEGMHILDMVTLAIRAARIYYTSHENPVRLDSIKSERRIREELLGVLEVLKKWAGKNFAGGLKDEQRSIMLGWISEVESMIDKERALEEADRQKRNSWIWASGDWLGPVREREQAFLQSFEASEEIPTWEPAESSTLPTPFLTRWQDGRRLVRLHNAAVKMSKRPFGEIRSFHEDVGKPYRMAENIRYWAKAAEIRWEIKLDVDALGIVNGDSDEAWRKLDQALLKWCQGVREELIRDWTMMMSCNPPRLPSPSPIIQSSPARCHVEFAFPRPSKVLDAVVEELRVTGFSGSPSSGNQLRTLTSLLRLSLFRSQLPPPRTTALFALSHDSARPANKLPGTTAGRPIASAKLITAAPSSEADVVTADRGVQASMPAAPSLSTSEPASIAVQIETSPATVASTSPGDQASTQQPPVPAAQRIPDSQTSGSSQRSTSLPQANNTSTTRVPTQDPKARSPSTFFRRLSPNLAARVKLLDGTAGSTAPAPRNLSSVGKISEAHIKELDNLHRDLSIKVQKRGRAWGGGRSTTHTPEPASTSGREEASQSECGHETESPIQSVVEPSTDGKADMSITEHSQTVAESTGACHGTSLDSSLEHTDLEKYLSRDDEQPPPPPPKDTPPPPPASGTPNVESYFNPLGLHRTDSIYSFSRASFSNQLSQLTSISLPQPAALEASIAAIPTASAAVRALTQAAEQIQQWINKASDVLSGLDADDDVEWAAAGGREGLEDVDKAVTKFESLINVYVKAIEDVQLRDDIADVGANQLHGVVIQMEATLQNWSKVRSLLKGVKEQVELAMEWEELWNAVLGDVGLEIENLARLIFEMEEKRHKTVIPDVDHGPGHGMNINELETIVEESPANGSAASNPRFSFAPVFPPASSQLDLQTSQNPQDETSLLALFARMQPLRASLDFLPMRLSMFQSRAATMFPSACEELEDRRQRLEKGYKKLETDAEALRRELGEDRWIIVFRNAVKQAHNMCDLVDRSVNKLQEAINGGIQHSNPAALAKRADNFGSKRSNYESAIERVLSIIQKGINDRLTVNGEIIRLLADLRARYAALQVTTSDMASLLDELCASRGQHMRDSVSSIVTLDTPPTKSVIDTPESSPASSVIMPNNSKTSGSRKDSATGNTVSKTTASKVKRYSGLPQPISPSSQTPKRTPAPRSASMGAAYLKSPTPRLTTTSPSPTPPRPDSRIGSSTNPSKPRWNHSSNTNDLMVGHNFKPLSLTTPSPHRRLPVPCRSASSTLPPRSPLSRESSASPAPGLRPPSHLNRGVTSSPTPRKPSLIDPPPYSKLRKSGPGASTPSQSLPSTPRSRQSYAGPPARESSVSRHVDDSRKSSRPGTAMGHSSRRVSLLPLPKARSGRDSAASNREDRPPWRY